MYHPPSKSSSKLVKSRLGLKITALFTGTFLAVFIGLLFYDLLAMMGDNLRVEAAVSGQPPVTALDPKLESDLAKVLEYADAQKTADIKNPFADQTGISDKTGTTNSPAAATVNPAAKTSNPAGTQNSPQRNQTPQNVAAQTFQPNQNTTPAPQMDTRARLQLRAEKIRLGLDAGPESAVFAIDDLLPVGAVSGGDGKEEVMFYSASACRVVSFPVGTQFYDGWFDSMRPEGVVFGFFDQYRTMRMRAWGRSVNTNCAQSLLETTSLNESQLTGGDD